MQHSRRLRMDLQMTNTITASLTEDFLKKEFEPKDLLISDLLRSRDLVTLAGRRREGKTTFLINLCVALAASGKFLGYEIPKHRRSLALFLEDDPGELQMKLARVVKDRDTAGRIQIVTREHFYEAEIPINIRQRTFKDAVRGMAQDHNPDLIVIDNLAHLVGAKYNDSELIHKLMVELYQWAKLFNAAIILAAHPRKDDFKHPIDLAKDPVQFFEAVMGSSHLINSTGSLWGLQRKDDLGYSVFLGGRQRGDGQQSFTLIEKGDDDWFRVKDDINRAASLALNTKLRRKAWNLIPPHPRTFGYREGQEAVQPAMSSSSSFNCWFNELKRHGLVFSVGDQYQKVPGDFTPIEWD